MVSGMLAKASAQAGHSARTVGIGLFASLALLVGLAFWTGAAWFLLLTVTTPLNACLVLGAVYTGAALVAFSVMSMRSKKPVAPPQPTKAAEANMETMMAAFMTGLNAGSRRRS